MNPPTLSDLLARIERSGFKVDFAVKIGEAWVVVRDANFEPLPGGRFRGGTLEEAIGRVVSFGRGVTVSPRAHPKQPG